MELAEQITENFNEAIKEAITTLLSSTPVVINTDHAQLAGAEVICSITFSGSMEGTSAIAISNACACKMVSKMLMMDITAVNSDVIEGTGEVLNMILGCVKIRLQKIGHALDISVPSFVQGQDLKLEGPEQVVTVNLEAAVDDFKFGTVFMYKVPDPSRPKKMKPKTSAVDASALLNNLITPGANPPPVTPAENPAVAAETPAVTKEAVPAGRGAADLLGAVMASSAEKPPAEKPAEKPAEEVKAADLLNNFIVSGVDNPSKAEPKSEGLKMAGAVDEKAAAAPDESAGAGPVPAKPEELTVVGMPFLIAGAGVEKKEKTAGEEPRAHASLLKAVMEDAVSAPAPAAVEPVKEKEGADDLSTEAMRKLDALLKERKQSGSY